MESFGKYQLVRPLGAGGMAEVFLARSEVAQGLQKTLVIKKIHPTFARSRHFTRMFVDEAKIALGLNHPNIVQVFDFGHVGQTFFLAMEHVDGVDLLRLMQEGAKKGRRVPHGLCAYIVQQVAKGLDYAHRKSDEYGEPLHIVHRDISPQNVLVSWDGSVKIVDFGIARARDVQEEEGIVKGKFAYMSPEQARGEPVDRRSDIFSAGIVLYELACARPLFATGKGKEVLELVKAGAIPRPRSVDPGLPPALEEIILKALAYHADDRYQTARDLQNALGRFQLFHAQSQNDLYDSGTLAQFVAQAVPRTRPQSGARDDTPPPRGTSRPAPPDPAPTPVGKRHPDTPAAPVSALTPAFAQAATPAETREKKQVLVLAGAVSGLGSLRAKVGEARAQKALAEWVRVVENIAYKHEAHPHRAEPVPEGALTYLIGLPVAGEDDPARAIRLALALVDALDGIGRDVEPDLRLSVGIQRGTALVTWRGASWEYELSPLTTSFARLLAQEAQGGEVLIGGGVFRVARAEWNFEELATVSLEGDLPDTSPGAQAKVYRLRGPKERAERMRERDGELALVGRELELKALRDAYRDVLVHRKKQHVMIIGEAGVGKRSLVAGFLKSLPPGEALVLRAAARAATADTPFSIVADLARDLLGLAEGAEPREIQRRILATATMLYPGQEQSREVAALMQTMGMLLGIRPPTGEGSADALAVDAVDADERRHRIREVLRLIEERLAQEQPVIVVVEDVHWADSQSWDLFSEIVNETAPRPVLGVATARPDERIVEASRAALQTTLVLLDELSPEERVRVVLDRIAGPPEDVRALADQIVAKAGGNPFFIKETIEALVERGVLVEGEGGKLVWVKREAPVQVPTSVESLVSTRLDRLPPAEKEALSRAAVLASAFAPADVAALLGRPVDDELRSLARRGLITTDRSRAGLYTFRNHLTVDVAYGLIPVDDRAGLHRRAADHIAGSPAYRAGQDDALVARHLERAGDAAGAARRYLAAGQHARDVHGNHEAFRHLSRALALLPKDAHAERWLARSEREPILRAWAQRPQQLRELHLLRREAEALGDDARLAESLTRLAQLYVDVDKASAAKRTLGPALDHARRAGDRLAEAEVLRIEAVLARETGRHAETLELCERALALCGEDRAGLLERAQILSTKGTSLWYMSRLREAIEAHAEALVIHRKLRVPRQEARALNNLGIVFAALGEFEEALTHYKRSLKIDQDLGDRVQVALKLSNIGQCYLDVGELDKAEQYVQKALGLANQLKDASTLTDGTIALGQIYLKRGEPRRAIRALERGLELAIQGRSRYQEIRGMIYLAAAQLAAGEPAAGVAEMARSAARLAHAAPLPLGEIYGLAIEGLALAAEGQVEEAERRAAGAVRLLDASRASEGADEILHIHYRLARAAGREAEALASLRRAMDDVQSKARRLRDPGLRATYLASPPARDIVADFAAAQRVG